MAGLEHPTLAVAAVVAGCVATVYLHLGKTLARRFVADATSRLALRMFALWWLATGTNIALGSLFIAAAALGWTNTPLQVAYAILQRLLLAAALVGLVHYLLVLVRGRASLQGIVFAYAVYFTALLGTLYASEPVGVYVGEWRTDLMYANEGAGPEWFGAVMGLGLVLPPVVLSIAAIVMARRLGPAQHVQRTRITLVGLALTVWWIVAVLAGQREAFGQEFFQVFNRLLGLSMALVILWAYKPPRWLAKHVESEPNRIEALQGPPVR